MVLANPIHMHKNAPHVSQAYRTPSSAIITAKVTARAHTHTHACAHTDAHMHMHARVACMMGFVNLSASLATLPHSSFFSPPT